MWKKYFTPPTKIFTQKVSHHKLILNVALGKCNDIYYNLPGNKEQTKLG